MFPRNGILYGLLVIAVILFILFLIGIHVHVG